MYSDFRQNVLILILTAITYILEFSNMHLSKKIYWFGCLMHLMLIIEMIVVMKVIMKVVKMKRSYIL